MVRDDGGGSGGAACAGELIHGSRVDPEPRDGIEPGAAVCVRDDAWIRERSGMEGVRSRAGLVSRRDQSGGVAGRAAAGLDGVLRELLWSQYRGEDARSIVRVVAAAGGCGERGGKHGA